MADYDLVIRGGTVVDGSGKDRFRADVAVKNGLIARVGAVDGKGAQEIDATGRIVTPGFVDVHTHYDGQVTWETRLLPSSNHGVTTVIGGNCGYSRNRDDHGHPVELGDLPRISRDAGEAAV
jgi:N-acyl-D-amino-acid deacylase